MLWLVAIAAGFGVANLYYAQPLAAAIALDLHASPAGISSALVGTQLGYAAGMLLLVPLGDVRERRTVIVATACGCAIALLAFAAAPTVPLLAAASVLVGLGASVVQMLLPFAVSLAPPEQRGRVVGIVMSGVLTGILLCRTASGALGEVVGWRTVFVLAAGVMVVLAAVLRVAIPPARPTQTLPYRALLASLWPILRRERVLRRRCLVGALTFGTFSVFWSTIAFELKDGPLHAGSATAGALGAIGVTGVVVGPIASRLAMRVRPAGINVVAMIVAAAGFAVFAAAAGSLVTLGAGIVLLDAGVQASHLTNQTVIFGLSQDQRNRVNAIYMIGYFLGGALGTALAAQAWQHGGWSAVCATGAAFALFAILPLYGEAGPREGESSSPG
ncbi:MAG TPA: MFS transporter [Kofleriaceae bacterium]|jgi:predicted MFS family arabinose efflux permease